MLRKVGLNNIDSILNNWILQLTDLSYHVLIVICLFIVFEKWITVYYLRIYILRSFLG